MAITLQAEYYYIDGVQQVSPSYGWAGYNTDNAKYYVSVAKYYTDSYISAPTFALYTGGMDNTNANKQLGVYFVACSENSTPSDTIITTPSSIANKHQTRIRFGYTYYASSGTFSSYNSTAWGYGQTTSNLVLAPGYFFVYIGTAQASSHTYSSHYTINSKYYPAQITASTPNTYTVSYNANGGTGAPSSQTKIQNISLTLSSTKPTKADTTNEVTGSFVITGDGNGGYFNSTTVTTTTITATTSRTDTTTFTFSKWNTKQDGSGTSYDAGASYTANAKATLYAQYTKSTTQGTTSYKNNAISGLAKPTKDKTTEATYTITFKANGGSCSTSSLSSNKTRTYTFKGWAESKTATSALANTKTYTAAKTVYAVWGKIDSTESITLPTPTRTGYEFVGWATTEDATTPDIGTGDYTPIATDTFYAVWKANGNIRIYVNDTNKYKMAMVYVYAPTNTSDTKPWKLVIPYLYTSGTQPWKIIAG